VKASGAFLCLSLEAFFIAGVKVLSCFVLHNTLAKNHAAFA
jgi:hypothetical protein